MVPHIEGGMWSGKKIFMSNDDVQLDDRPGTRKLSSQIYYLLRQNDIDKFHILKSDEIWLYHAGGTLTLFVIDPKTRTLTSHRLGLGPDAEVSVLLQRGTYFAAIGGAPYTLVSCFVTPGYADEDFTMISESELATKPLPKRIPKPSAHRSSGRSIQNNNSRIISRESAISTLDQESACSKAEKLKQQRLNDEYQLTIGKLKTATEELENQLLLSIQDVQAHYQENHDKSKQIQEAKQALEKIRAEKKEIQKSIELTGSLEAKTSNLRQLQFKYACINKSICDLEDEISHDNYLDPPGLIQRFSQDIEELTIKTRNIQKEILLLQAKTQSIAETQSLATLDKLSTEIKTKIKARQSLIHISKLAPMQSSVLSQVQSVDPSFVFDPNNFEELNRYIQEAAQHLERSGETSTQLNNLYREMERVNQLLEAEEKEIQEEHSSEQAILDEIQEIEARISSTKEGTKNINEQSSKINEYIDRLYQERSQLRKDLGDLAACEKPEIQQLIGDIEQFRAKSEDENDKLRRCEAEFQAKSEKLQEIRSSNGMNEYEELQEKKKKLEHEIQELKTQIQEIQASVDDPTTMAVSLCAQHENIEKQLSQSQAILQYDRNQLQKLESYYSQLQELR